MMSGCGGQSRRVDKRVLSMADQLRVVQEALAGWEPSNAEER